MGVEEYGLDTRGRRRVGKARKVRGEEVALRRVVRGRARATSERMRGVDMVVVSSRRSVVGLAEM